METRIDSNQSEKHPDYIVDFIVFYALPFRGEQYSAFPYPLFSSIIENPA